MSESAKPLRIFSLHSSPYTRTLASSDYTLTDNPNVANVHSGVDVTKAVYTHALALLYKWQKNACVLVIDHDKIKEEYDLAIKSTTPGAFWSEDEQQDQ